MHKIHERSDSECLFSSYEATNISSASINPAPGHIMYRFEY
jgi:hypothetical protein